MWCVHTLTHSEMSGTACAGTSVCVLSVHSQCLVHLAPCDLDAGVGICWASVIKFEVKQLTGLIPHCRMVCVQIDSRVCFHGDGERTVQHCGSHYDNLLAQIYHYVCVFCT